MMNAKMNRAENKVQARRGEIRQESVREAGLRRGSWTEFYTHSAVPALFNAQDCFKQEQR